MCWCVYNSVIGKQSMLGVQRGLEDIFNLTMPSSQMYGFKSILASYYSKLNEELLATALEF